LPYAFFKTYEPKHQPHVVPQHFLLGERQSRRAIAQYLSGRGEAHYFNIACTARPERILAHIPLALRLVSSTGSPAIAAAQLVCSACAPGSLRHIRQFAALCL
jgi:hypothetical protein